MRRVNQEPTPPWRAVDELNWAADQAVIHDLHQHGEQPSDWLAAEYQELSKRREETKGKTA